MKINKIGFIGFGLIGASIAKKIKYDKPETVIIATAKHEQTIIDAYKLNLINNDTLLSLNSFNDCDIIFLCAPVKYNIAYLKKLKDIIKPSCIITDVGSTKNEIHKMVSTLNLEKNFIGGHPMTGSEKVGLANANRYLLENAYYIITPTNETTEENLKDFSKFVSSLGSIPLILNYKFHDHATAAISHLPHMIAYSLVALIEEIDNNEQIMKTIAAGGFRDMTRIAASSPAMWQSICMSNTEEITNLIGKFQEKLSSLKEMLLTNPESKELYAFFEDCKEYRDSMLIPVSNLQQMTFELYLDLIDEAGSIATIATILATNQISIKNIGIINNREFEEGVLRIEFYDESSLNKSKNILKAKNYTIYQRKQ
ncbi:prephenate dehydrogenase/arogenate dehydrogenase family protein [Lachnobacterium bovis]|uniref:Prephenate dehydrogenase n=1 Tax=Lachnobacterium bovis TaxID=140626 RepID=A0A1H9PT43_9FIRM|nr:prephenate dehydrogenase/arogenate dehydrogenase family protein [Lachnobacterium bovis]SER50743.1 prephenate dehydrogenase [Lachnobacterium bovis]